MTCEFLYRSVCLLTISIVPIFSSWNSRLRTSVLYPVPPACVIYVRFGFFFALSKKWIHRFLFLSPIDFLPERKSLPTFLSWLLYTHDSKTQILATPPYLNNSCNPWGLSGITTTPNIKTEKIEISNLKLQNCMAWSVFPWWLIHGIIPQVN